MIHVSFEFMYDLQQVVLVRVRLYSDCLFVQLELV